MSVLGVAEILILPKTDGFEQKLKDQGVFKGFASDAEMAGAQAGTSLEQGVGKGTKRIEGDLEKSGKKSAGLFSRGLQSGLSALGGFGLPVGPLQEGLHKAGEAAGAADSKTRGFSQTLDHIGGVALLGTTAALAGAAVEGFHLATSMETADTAIANATGQSVASAKAIGDAFLGTAGKTEFSAQEIASAYAMVAGQLQAAEGHTLSAAEANKFMAATQELATAKGIDLATATSVVGGVMQAYQVPVSQAAHVTDVLMNTSNATGQSIDTLASTMEKIRGKMGASAPPLEQVSTLLVDLTNHGLTGKIAVGALSTAFTGLIEPSGKLTKAQQAVADEQKRLGLHFADSQGHLKDVGQIIGQVEPLIRGMSAANATAVLHSIGFGAASAKLVDTIQGGIPAYDQAAKAALRTGSAHQGAENKAHTFKVEMQTLKVAAEDLLTKFGQVLIPVLNKVGRVFVDVTGFVMSHKAVLWGLGILIGGFLTTAIAVFTVNKMVAFGDSFMAAGKAIGGMISNIPKAITAILGMGTATEVAGGEMAAGSALGGAALEGVGTSAEVMATDVEGAAVATDAAIGSTGIGLLLIGLGIGITLLATHWKQVWGGIKDAAMAVWHFLEHNWKTVVEILLGPIGPLIYAWDHFHKQIIGFFVSIGHWIEHVWDTVKHDTLALVDGVVHFFESLPGRVIHFIENAAGSVLKAFEKWIPGGGIIGGLISGIGHLFADGGVVTKPTLGIVGEAGPEIVMPLKHLNSGVAQSIMAGGDVRQLGLSGGSSLGGAPSTASTAPAQTVIHLTINGSNMTPQETMSEVSWLAHTGAFH